MSTIPAAVAPGATITLPIRMRVFIDFWNLQILLNHREADATSVPGTKFRIDWQRLPQSLVKRAASLLGATSYTYDGTIVFTSYDARTEEGRKYHGWLKNWLDKQPGIQVQAYERRPRGDMRCQSCHKAIATCPHCSVQIGGTVEKGVDTAIATDMIRLAWEKAYDVGVLVTSDADLVPAVEFLDLKGVRVIQAGFPPHGSHLARACWGSFDLFACREEFRHSKS